MLYHFNFADCAGRALYPSFAEMTDFCTQYGSEIEELSGQEVEFFLGVQIPLCRS